MTGEGGADMGIDQIARDTANRAIAVIESHERVCTERWSEIRRMMDLATAQNKEDVSAVRRGIEGLYDRLAGVRLQQASTDGQLSGRGRMLWLVCTCLFAGASLLISAASLILHH
jgi:hypothetical protein